MLRVELGNLRPGMKLAMPVRHPRKHEHVLLNTDFRLTPETIRSLRQHRIPAVWVRCPALASMNRFVNDRVNSAQAKVIGQITSAFETLQGDAPARLPYHEYTAAITSLVSRLIENPRAALLLSELSLAVRDDLVRHSAAVTYLSLLMGLKLEGYLVQQRSRIDPARAKEVTSLGLGAMMHDIGILKLATSVVQRYRRSNDESDPEWREHTALGYQHVRGDVDPSAAAVVLNHHQRWDGSGYSGSGFPVLQGERIHVFARIVGLAEQFDRLKHPLNLPEQPTAWVLQTMLDQPLYSRFDPTVLYAMLAVAPAYPPGSVVQLSDGRWGVCLDHKPNAPCRPNVQIVPPPEAFDPETAEPGEVVELSRQSPKLFIAKHNGVDVTELNFYLSDQIREWGGVATPDAA